MIKALLLLTFLLVGFVLGASYGVATERQNRSIEIADCVLQNIQQDKTGYEVIKCILKNK